jgi:hypothetical protein
MRPDIPPEPRTVRLSSGATRLLSQLGPGDYGHRIVGWSDEHGHHYDGSPPFVTWPPRPTGRSRAKAAGPGLFGD